MKRKVKTNLNGLKASLQNSNLNNDKNFETEIDGLTVHYSFDNSFPDYHYPAYGRTPVEVPVDAAPLKVVTYRAGKQVGRVMTISVEDLRKRVK